jgi:lysophospholipase L1-like esterase
MAVKTIFQKIDTRIREELQKRGSIYFSYIDVTFKYPWLCLYNAGLTLEAKLFNRAIIHVIGDSHLRPFVFRRPFLLHHISQATAYNLNKDGSFSESKRYLKSFLPAINKQRDVMLLVFGEIDARVHIYLQYEKNNKKISMGRFIDATVEKYGETIRRLKGDGFAVCVHGLPPAARKNFESNLPFLGSPEQRSEISREFNIKLGEFCRKSGVAFIDMQSIAADDNGFMKKEYAADEVHLNSKVVPFARDRIVEAFGGRKNFTKTLNHTTKR